MRDHRLYLDDILEATKRIERYVNGFTLRKLKNDNLVMDGVVRNLEILGEAAKKIPAGIKEKYPEVEWKKIAGLRDVLAHEYFGLDMEVVWDVIQHKLPVLKKKVTHILREIK